ncbi:MAG TPA: hypothetical protein VMR62_11870 [Bryobacteraceae bacterium]|jgi:hypothetical protein|nr:hypothetical protein [Bryobacteraceae bacterium]
MRRAAKRAAKWLAIAAAVLLAAGIAAPYLTVNQFAPRIRTALEGGLGRRVDFGAVHFSLFAGPGFSVDNVIIHENPAIGIEPIAYVGSLEAVPRLASIFGGRLEFASIRLDDASINVAKTGAPSEPGRWNFEPLLSRSVIRAIPELHVRSGRINFKFGDTKSVFYLTNTDLDIAPPSHGAATWNLEFTGEPARTDKPARGLGEFIARGRWNQTGPGRLDLDVRLEKSAISEIVALLHGFDAGIHGTVSARMHLAGSLDDIRISGRMDVEDVHRWDRMPPYGQSWPLRLAGRLNLPAQTVEVESTTAGGETLPLAVRFRCSDYLSQPHWGVALNWNRFPAGPLLDLARHLGADLPPKISVSGTLDGVLGYEAQGSLQGQLDFHDASVATLGSPPIRSAEALLIFGGGLARLAPAEVRTAQDETAQLEGDYAWKEQRLDLTITTGAMQVASLRAQAALAAIPWLEQISGGTWKGQLRYQIAAPAATLAALAKNGWTGDIDLQDAQFPLPGLAEPVMVATAAAHIDGARVALDHMHARAGKLAMQGDYRYEPQMVRPHRLRLRIAESDAAELERLLMPALRHNRGLIARALSLGRVSLPDWLANCHLDAAVQIGVLHLAGADAHDLQAHLLWDVTKAEFADLRAALDGGRVTGTLSVNLRGNRPTYRLQAQAKGVDWKSGKVDANTVLESSGTGVELLARLHSSGAFVARGLDVDALPDLESVSGAYDLVWNQAAPILRFTELQLVAGDETYTGQGATQTDGRLLFQLTSGTKEMQVSGTLAELRVDQPVSR